MYICITYFQPRILVVKYVQVAPPNNRQFRASCLIQQRHAHSDACTVAMWFLVLKSIQCSYYAIDYSEMMRCCKEKVTIDYKNFTPDLSKHTAYVLDQSDKCRVSVLSPYALNHTVSVISATSPILVSPIQRVQPVRH